MLCPSLWPTVNFKSDFALSKFTFAEDFSKSFGFSYYLTNPFWVSRQGGGGAVAPELRLVMVLWEAASEDVNTGTLLCAGQ